MTSINSIIIPGLAGLGDLSAQAAYGILQKNGDTKELATVAAAPQIKREQDYFDKTIKTIKSVDDFLKDRRLVGYVLTAYGLQSEANKTGILAKVFKEDPNLKASLVNKLADSRFAKMAKDLNIFNVGLTNLQTATSKDEFKLQSIGNRYFEVQSQTATGDAIKTLFSNNASVTVGADGKLQAADKFYAMGMKLDNRGQLQPAANAVKGYQTAEIKPVQVNWFDNKFTPTQTLIPQTILNSDQPVANINSYSVAQTVKDPSGATQVIQVKLNRADSSTNQWSFTVTDSSNNVLTSGTHALGFGSDGELSTIYGDSKTSLSSSLTWSGGTTTEAFDLKSLAHHADFSQTTGVYDQTGLKRNVRLEYNKVDAGTNRWQVKVYNDDLNTLGGTLDVQFNNDGTVKIAGTYNTDTNKIEIKTGDSVQSASVAVDWQRGYGPSTLSIDFSGMTSRAGGNYAIKPIAMDSIALGQRTSVDIDKNGIVSATYNKADGSGTKKINLYQLANASFEKPAALLEAIDKTGYFTDSGQAGTTTYRPSSTLAADAKNTTTMSFLDTLKKNYRSSQYEVALGDENNALRYAVYFKKHAGAITNMYNLMGDKALHDVVAKVFQLPTSMAKQPIETQEAVFSRHLDIKKLKDPKFVDQFIKRFLAASDADGTNTKTSIYSSILDGSGSSSDLISLVGNRVNTSA